MRSRGRPQTRSDPDTRLAIIDVADHLFHRDGYGDTSMCAVAAEAGVSTRTVYRLIENKETLFAEVVASNIDRFFLGLDQRSLEKCDLREGLIRILNAYGTLTLSAKTAKMSRIIAAESKHFPALSYAFQERAVVPTNAVLEDWLKRARDAGEIKLDNVHQACGMLRGMMIMEPQNATVLRHIEPMTPEEVMDRAIMCADSFLRGWTAKSVGA